MKLWFNQHGNTDMIAMGIIAAMMFAIAIPIIFTTMTSLNQSSIDTTIKTNVFGSSYPCSNNASNTSYNNTRFAGNATDNLLTQVNSFFSIGPIYLIVVVAVGIIASLMILRKVA